MNGSEYKRSLLEVVPTLYQNESEKIPAITVIQNKREREILPARLKIMAGISTTPPVRRIPAKSAGYSCMGCSVDNSVTTVSMHMVTDKLSLPYESIGTSIMRSLPPFEEERVTNSVPSTPIASRLFNSSPAIFASPSIINIYTPLSFS